MRVAFEPGRVLVVDESMALWKGKGMPGKMHVPMKPTTDGREAHTTADAETGALIFTDGAIRGQGADGQARIR